MSSTHPKNNTYCCGQVAAFVSADPAQAADNIEHLELELHKRRGTRIKLPFIKTMQPTETAGGETRGILSPPVSGNSSDSIFASVLKRFWMLIILESGGTPLQMHAFLFTYCCRLPPSTSRSDHLAKHFVAVQRDVVGCFNGPLCHLLTVHIDLDFVWRDGDVELRGIERGFN